MRLSWMLLLGTGAAAGCAAAWMWKRRKAEPRRRRSGTTTAAGRIRLRNGHAVAGRFQRRAGGRRRTRLAVSAS